MTPAAAIKAAGRAQAALDKAETTATSAALKRDTAILEAKVAGATYVDLEAATGLSRTRVTQVLRRERKRRA